MMTMMYTALVLLVLAADLYWNSGIWQFKNR